MDPDTEDAAWHQLELECMEQFETRDPAYEEWLDKFSQEEYEHEFDCER